MTMVLPIYAITYSSFDGNELYTETKIKTSLDEALKCQNTNLYSISQDIYSLCQDEDKADDFYTQNKDALHIAFEDGNVFMRTDVVTREYEFYLQERP